ncbi:MAG: hypothetical protein IIA07_12080, partial [Proteobacteria bacterium]|nr:hypothetical protein [Pseudomonadota bacterium]
VGVHAARALAYALNKPILGVNHLEGHVYANLLSLRDKGYGIRDKDQTKSSPKPYTQTPNPIGFRRRVPLLRLKQRCISLFLCLSQDIETRYRLALKSRAGIVETQTRRCQGSPLSAR